MKDYKVYNPPLYIDPYYTYSTNMHGHNFLMEYTFNGVSDCWYLDIMDSEDRYIKRGIKISNGVMSSFRYRGITFEYRVLCTNPEVNKRRSGYDRIEDLLLLVAVEE